jgi:hypothetical protein
MKRRIVRYVTGACVAGVVLSAGGALAPDQALAVETENGEWQVSVNENITLYGPPSTFDPDAPVQPLYGPPPEGFIEPPQQVLYGPPPIDLRVNPMTVTVHDRAVAASRLAESRKVFKRAIVVSKAKGEVSFEKVAKGSSDQLIVNKKTGMIAVKKGTKKGLYTINVRVSTPGTAKYANAAEIVTVNVRVK